MRPLIGVCAALEHAQWGAWSLACDLLPRMYVDAVQAAGGAAILLPADDGWIDDAPQLLDRLDGLLLAGGADIDPAIYGEQRHEKTVNTLPARDACEIALINAALDRDMPMLGICRGMQLMNVAAGGTLIQHVPDRTDAPHINTPGSFEGSEHDVELLPGSLAERAAGASRPQVNSHHHQAVDRLGERLVLSAWSTPEQLAEAIEHPDRRFALGVQWHPEADPNDTVVATFVETVAAAIG